MQKVKSFVSATAEHVFAPKNVFKAGFRKKGDIAQLIEESKEKEKHDRRYFCIEVHGKSLCLAKTPLFLFAMMCSFCRRFALGRCGLVSGSISIKPLCGLSF